MFRDCKPSPRTAAILGIAVLLVTAPFAVAGSPPYGVPSGVMPWEYFKYYKGYKEAPHGSGRRPAPPSVVSQAPKKYTVQVARVPYRHTESPSVALVMAHVPEDASIWFEESPTRQKGALRYFESVPLQSGRSYSYAARVVWYEDGEWVTQTVTVPLKAGEVSCLYIVHADQSKELAKITENLEKLSAEDQKQALQQKVCAVQDDKPLGSMGVPFKLTVKDQLVFLCCDACAKDALSNPERTLERVKKSRAATTHSTPHH